MVQIREIISDLTPYMSFVNDTGLHHLMTNAQINNINEAYEQVKYYQHRPMTHDIPLSNTVTITNWR